MRFARSSFRDSLPWKAFGVFGLLLLIMPRGWAEDLPACTVDPVTRYIHVSYAVPRDAPDEVTILCSWSPAGKGDWHPAKVMAFVSETAMNLLPRDTWADWRRGRITERRAAGLTRTVLFNPYPEAEFSGTPSVDFRIEIQGPDAKALAACETPVSLAARKDIVYLEDWSKVLQQDALGTLKYDRAWSCRSALPESEESTFGNDLYGVSPGDLALPPLSYPLDLQGPYAIFVCTSASKGGMRLRLSSDERTDMLASRFAGQEVFWRWAVMDRQQLVLKQPHGYKGCSPAHIDYVKLVPLSAEMAGQLDGAFGSPDRFVAGYWEPYSWAFYDDVQNVLQHREQITAFRDARISLLDTQIGRFGMKVVYESRKTDPLYYRTIGDPEPGDNNPLTDNVGKMQQFTNTLDATIRAARELGLQAHANFGASNCYPGSPLQGDFSKAHPDWMRGSALRFEVPEVRGYALTLYREALDIGAPGISIDFCRYPETVDSVETGNTFMQAMSALAKEYARRRGNAVPVLVRFPGTGVRRAEFFDYRTWAREGWVDYLCPSNIQGWPLYIDMAPYLDAVQHTACKLLPEIDALGWGLPMPGPFLWWVNHLYELGAPGLYIYQADGRVLGAPGERRCMRLLASSEGVRRWWEDDARLRPARSKGIYFSAPEGPDGSYHGYERVRVWLEGIPLGPVEMYLDEQLVTRAEGPPYTLGKEEETANGVIPKGEHRLRIRARDGEGWLEQTFTVRGG